MNIPGHVLVRTCFASLKLHCKRLLRLSSKTTRNSNFTLSMSTDSVVPAHRDSPASATHESSTLSRKRTSLNGDETLEWMSTRYLESASMSEDRLSPSRPRKRTREITPTISPFLLSTFAAEGDETVPAPAHILNDVGLYDAELTPELEQPGRQWVSTCDSVGLDGETTDPDPDSETLFSLYLRSPSPTCTSVSEPSGCSSDTAVDPAPDESLLTPSAELLSGALDRNTAGAGGQSHAAAKPTRIRLRLKPPSERPQGNKIILRLKGPKLGKRARKGRKKA